MPTLESCWDRQSFELNANRGSSASPLRSPCDLLLRPFFDGTIVLRTACAPRDCRSAFEPKAEISKTSPFFSGYRYNRVPWFVCNPLVSHSARTALVGGDLDREETSTGYFAHLDSILHSHFLNLLSGCVFRGSIQTHHCFLRCFCRSLDG